jgi:hypothetical protein
MPTTSTIVPFEKEKKRSHDAAYLLILLTILGGTFLFVTFFVNYMLHGIPIPH